MKEVKLDGITHITEVGICDGQGESSYLVLDEPIEVKPNDAVAVGYVDGVLTLFINEEPVT